MQLSITVCGRCCHKTKGSIDCMVQEVQKTLHCEDCGQDHPATLEFHHMDPSKKDFNVSRLIAQSTSLPQLKEEMAKCDVLSAYCHRIRHWNERRELDEPF